MTNWAYIQEHRRANEISQRERQLEDELKRCREKLGYATIRISKLEKQNAELHAKLKARNIRSP